MATSALSYFWQLASSSKEERLASAHALVNALVVEQEAKGPKGSKLTSLPVRDIARAPDEVSEVEYQEAEAALAQQTSSDTAYAVKRLIKGLASHRESARLGFSIALCELLSRLQGFPAQHILNLILAYSTPEGKVKGQEERDLIFARLFGIHALLRSGALTRDGDHTARQEFDRAVEVLWIMKNGKAWLRESAASVLVQGIEALSRCSNEWKDACFKGLVERVCNERPVTPENIAIYITLQTSQPQLLSSSQRLPHFSNQHTLANDNLPALARALSGTAPSDEQEQENSSEGAPILSAGSAKAHFVWRLIWEQYRESGEAKGKQHASLADAFRILVDENLFALTASNQKKIWGFQAFEAALQIVPADVAEQLMTPNLLRSMMNQLGGKRHEQSKNALAACTAIQRRVTENPSVAIEIALVLVGKNGNLRFDSSTKTKTLESILQSANSKEVGRFSDLLIAKACQADVEEGALKAIFDLLLSLVRNAQIDTDETAISNILNFFAAHGLFAMQTPIKKVKSSEKSLGNLPVTPFSPSIRAACCSRFLSCLSDLFSSDVQWIARGHALVEKLQLNDKHFKAVRNLNLSQAEALKALHATIEASEKNQSDARKAALHHLAWAIKLYLLSTHHEEEVADVINPLIDFVKSRSIPVSKQTTEPGSIDLLVDCLTSLLQPPSAFLRSIVTHAFDAFSADMTSQSLQLLIDHLGFNQEEGRSENQAASDIEDEASNESDDGQDEVFSDSASDGSAETSDADDDEADVDAAFAAKVREALRSGNAEDSDKEEASDDEESDEDESERESESLVKELSDFDDEQMMLMDEKLADIFRQKFSSRREEEVAKKEEVAYHVRIIDLLDHYVKHNATSSTCISLVLPLFTMALEKDKAMEALRQRAGTVLQKSMSKGKQWPTVTTDADLKSAASALDAIHKVASSGLSAPQLSLASAANAYLTRSSTDGDQVPQEIISTYASTVKDFVERKGNDLKPQFLIDAFTRFPKVGFSLRQDMLDSVTGPQVSSQHSFRQLQVTEMLRVSLTQIVAQRHSFTAKGPSADDEIVIIHDLLRKLAQLVLQRAKADNLRLKDILKTGLQFARLTIRLAEASGDKTLVKRTWPMEEIQESITALGSTNTQSNSASLQTLLKQILALVEKANGTIDGAENIKAIKKRSPEALPASDKLASSKKSKRK